MIFVQVLLSIIYFFVIPILLGKLITYFNKEKEQLLLEIILGYLIKFALLELVSIPLILLNTTFTILCVTYLCIIIVLTIISIILNFKNMILKIKYYKIRFKEELILKICTILLIGFQLFNTIFFTHIELDDSFYVAQSLTSIETNTLYQINPSQGNYYGTYMRYALSPFPMYMSIASIFTNIHSTIIWHTILPAILLLIAYFIYYLFAKKLFKDKRKELTFLCMLSIINIWGNITIATSFSYLLLNISQGKSVLANIILPFLWYAFFDCVEQEKNIINWIILEITIIAGCLVSGMGIVLLPISLGMLALIFSIKEKRLEILFKSAISMIPCIILGVIFILN